MKQSLYLETSVIGAYLDNGDPFRRDLTIRWFEHELSEYRAWSSILVQRELERIDEPHRTGYLKIINGMERLELAEEVARINGEEAFYIPFNGAGFYDGIAKNNMRNVPERTSGSWVVSTPGNLNCETFFFRKGGK